LAASSDRGGQDTTTTTTTDTTANAAAVVDPQIWIAVNGASTHLVVHTLDPGTGTATSTGTLYNGAASFTNQFQHIADVELAPAVGDYFLLEANGNGDNKILQGNLTNALAGTSPIFTTLFSDTNY
jgi:hypothetical protein